MIVSFVLYMGDSTESHVAYWIWLTVSYLVAAQLFLGPLYSSHISYLLTYLTILRKENIKELILFNRPKLFVNNNWNDNNEVVVADDSNDRKSVICTLVKRLLLLLSSIRICCMCMYCTVNTVYSHNHFLLWRHSNIFDLNVAKWRNRRSAHFIHVSRRVDGRKKQQQQQPIEVRRFLKWNREKEKNEKYNFFFFLFSLINEI